MLLLLQLLSVHPRVCGEQDHDRQERGSGGGSSPRVRGTESIQPGRAVVLRFIPACAGNSWSKTRPRNRVPVHPRVCGEQFHLLKSEIDFDGSSPRVRGTAAEIEKLVG